MEGVSSNWLEALVLRLKADYELRDENPWEEKGRLNRNASKPALRNRAIRSERYARKAIQLLVGLGIDVASPVSHLRSLVGRALTIRATLLKDRSDAKRMFDEAFSFFDLSRAGLRSLPIERREAQAAGLLRLAEATLLRSDADLSGAPKTKTKAALDSARREISRAQRQLNTAETILNRTRRALEWWNCLFQVRGQLEVERLLLVIAESYEPAPRISEPSGEDQLASQSRKHNDSIASFQASIRRGVLAVRLGLDILLPGVAQRRKQETELHRDPRLKRLLRIWLELMICGTALTALSSDRVQTSKHLLHVWTETNRLEGILKLPKARGIENWLADSYDYFKSELPGNEEGCVARRKIVIEHMNDFFRTGRPLSQILEVLIESA